MKALVYEGPRALALRDAPDPQPRDGALTLRVQAVGICGSDMHAWAGHDERRPAPLILGHEAAGVLTDGSGRRVTVNPLVTCGVCADCLAGRDNICARRQIISMPPREGAFAELVAMPPENLIDVPAHVPLEKAALAEPLACGWHGVRLATGAMALPLTESHCLILGGGAIGLGAALVLAAQGAREVWIAETNPARRAVLARAGDFRVFDPRDGGGPEADSAHLVVDAVGFEATRAAACVAVRRGGVILHIGLGSASGGLDVRRMTLQEITFIGAYTYTKTDFRACAQALFDGRLGALDWPELRPLADGAQAFDDIAAGRAAAPKIILQP